jgi:uncharacterized lipoprotein
MKLVCTFLAVLAIAACSEKPQDPPVARDGGEQSDNWQHQLRSRNQGQNEASRIY